MFLTHTLAFNSPFATQLAKRLLVQCGDDLPRTLVVLPSARAASTLSFALLEAAGAQAVLLPEITTPARLIEDLAGCMPHISDALLPDSARELILSASMNDVSWLRDRRESIPGLAAELLKLFDDLRLYGRDPDDPCPIPPGAPDKLIEDHRRVQEAWRLYRRKAPYDSVDRTLSVVASVEENATWPGAPIHNLVVAGFVDLNPTWARLLHAAAAGALSAELVLSAPSPDDHLSHCFLATYSDHGKATSPLHTDIQVRDRMGLPYETPTRDHRPLLERLAEIGTRKTLSALPDRPVTLSCSDPEQESLNIASLIIERLEHQPDAKICLATNDRTLGRRVALQLRDAGLSDLDESSGLALSAEPEGLLVWALLRCAVTRLGHEPLMELLTHPLVDFGRNQGLHRKRSLRFERELLRGQLAGVGLEGYRTRALEKDIAVSEGRSEPTHEMENLIDDLAGALTPLLSQRETAPVADLVLMLRRAWFAVAPKAILDDQIEAADDRTMAARRALHSLLEDLSECSSLLPAMMISDFSAALARLISNIQIMPRRSPFLPVRVTGLLEARLEHFDLLILGGMDEERMPGKLPRPLFLGGIGRESAGLSSWRETMGMQAELFLRLLHNGDKTVITWPRERDGQPVLPSPFVTRLKMTLGDNADTSSTPAIYGVADQDGLDPTVAQTAFSSEPMPTTAHAATRVPTSVSHTALKTYRECPYRYLLERGFGLREQDEVIDRLQKRDMGEIVHACLAKFLIPGGPARRLLLNGDRDGAMSLLSRITEDEFAARASGLPQRRLWQASFLRLAPELIDTEIGRADAWEPVALEAEFCFTLDDLRGWLGDPPPDANAPGDPPLLIKGRIDRVDVAVDAEDDPRYAVLDYKTGATPSKKDIVEGKDLQLSLYALAVELNSVDGLAKKGPVVEGAYYTLQPGKTKIEGPHFPHDADLVRDARTILETALALANPDLAYPRAPEAEDEREPAVCRYCAVEGLCRRDERLTAAGLEGAS